MADYKSGYGDVVRAAVGDTPYRTVARAANISAAYLSDIIQGRVPNRDVVIALAEALGADVNEHLWAAGFAPIQGGSESSAYDAAADLTGAQVLARGLAELAREYQKPESAIPVALFGGTENLTPEKAREWLVTIRKLLYEGHV
jgi:transcriptional regulator with XRE-family HTH domain